MYAAKKTPEEQYQLVLECRSSGLPDCGWCRKNGINPNTFKKLSAFLPQVQTGKFNQCSKITSYAMQGQDWLMEVC